MIESERHGEKFYKSLGLFMDGIMLINHWKKVQLETFENIFPRITSEIETVGYNIIFQIGLKTLQKVYSMQSFITK